MESVLIVVIALSFVADGVRGDTCLPPAAAERCQKDLQPGQYPFWTWRGGKGGEVHGS